MPLRWRYAAHVPGTVRAGVTALGGRAVVQVASVSGHHRGALTRADGDTIAAAARLALAERLPLVVVLSSSGAEVTEGIDSLHGWGAAARALSGCSGSVPVLAAVTGPALSGPALLLGLADVTVMTTRAFAFLSGPDAVEGFTGVRVGLHALGGTTMHATASGLCALVAAHEAQVPDLLASVLSYLPDHADAAPPRLASDDPAQRPTPELRELVPVSATSSYDVRDVIAALADDGELLELRPGWAPQLVTALASIAGMPCGVVANQPRSLAGTLDIPASQKGARFVRFCDAFNLPLLTLVDTPGFLPGKDLEWRGMIRHGAELAFAYAEATVPACACRAAQGLRRGVHRHGLPGDRQRRLSGVALGRDRRDGGRGGGADPRALERRRRARRARGALCGPVPHPVGGSRAGVRRRRDRPRLHPGRREPGPVDARHPT